MGPVTGPRKLDNTEGKGSCRGAVTWDPTSTVDGAALLVKPVIYTENFTIDSDSVEASVRAINIETNGSNLGGMMAF